MEADGESIDGTPGIFAVVYPQNSNKVAKPEDAANVIANSEDPDQTAPLGAVWSGSALFV